MPQDTPPQGSSSPTGQKAISGGLSLVKLLVVIGGVAAALSILISVLTATRQHSCCRQKCPSNLRQIGQAMNLYANDYKSYPRTYYDPTVLASFKPDFTGGAKTNPSSNPFLPQPLGSVGVNNTLAAMFLLVRTTDLNQEVFICPSSNQEKDAFTNTAGTVFTSKDVSNFTSANNISYSFANPYPTSQGVAAGGKSPINLGYQWSPYVTADFAIAADRNDGFTAPADAAQVASVTSASPAAQQRLANSRNHGQDGQNVLYNDGHVEWAQYMWVGANKDGIYTAAKTAPVAAGSQIVLYDDGHREVPTTMWVGGNKDNIYIAPRTMPVTADSQIVLYNDGHHEMPTTMWVGAEIENIYIAPRTMPAAGGKFGQLNPAASKDTVTADPQFDLDTVLIPKF